MPTVSSPYPAAGGFVPPVTGQTLGRDAFLQLLVTQLSNQDPLNPQEGHEFAAQLAQFSSVEQLAVIGELIGFQTQLLGGLAADLDAAALEQAALSELLTERMDLASAAGLIGQTVEAEGNHAVWNGTDPATIGFELPEPAADVRVVIRNEDGTIVRTLELGHLGTGRHLPTWDGLHDEGGPVAPGVYSFSVEATDAGGDRIEATPFTRGRVDRITIGDDGVLLWIGALSIPMTELHGLAS